MFSKNFFLLSILALLFSSFYSFGSIKIDVDPKAVIFDPTDVGDRSDSKIIKVKNTGTDKFIIFDIGLTGDDEDFKIINEDCEGSTLNENEECSIEVVFAPKSKGVKAAALDLKIVGDGLKTEEVGLSGVATLGGLLEVSPSKHDFGTVDEGDSKSYIFTIKNKSDETVQVKEIKLKLDDDNFKLNLNGGDNPCGSETLILNSGESCTIEITFEPEDKGIKTSTLAVEYELDGTELYTAAVLVGTGGEFNTNLLDLKIKPSSKDFGEVEIGDSKSLEITLKNDGDKLIQIKDITLKEIEINGDDDFYLNLNGGSNPCGSENFTLDPETSCTIELVFEPQDKGTQKAVLFVKYEVDGDTSYNGGFYTGKGSEGGDSGNGGCSFITANPTLPFYLIIPVLVALRRFIKRD